MASFRLRFEQLSLGLDILVDQAELAIKHDRTTTVGRISAGEEKILLKRYNARNLWHRFKRAFRQSRAQRCWRMSYVFQRAGLNVAPPKFMLERRYGPIQSDAFFATSYLQGEELLSSLPKMDQSSRERVRRALEEAFESMRRNKITHGDMKASNLLWVDEQLFFIDLDAAQQHKSVLSWAPAHRKDVKRFMKNWQSNPELQSLFSHLTA